MTKYFYLLLFSVVVINLVPVSSAHNMSHLIGIGRSGYVDHHHHHISSHGHGGHGGGHSSFHHGLFQNFFDIALTGLAFLSFGIFLLNLLLNTLVGTGTGGGGNVTGTLLPTNTGGIITNTLVTNARGSDRRKRATFELYLDPVTSMETLAATVLKSIDAMIEEHECLQKVFCDGNKEARVIGSGFQYLMPAYSVGASYIGQKTGFHKSFSDHVKAVVLGMEESNCQSHFPQC